MTLPHRVPARRTVAIPATSVGPSQSLAAQPARVAHVGCALPNLPTTFEDEARSVRSRRPTAGPAEAGRSIARLKPDRRSIRRGNPVAPHAKRHNPLRLRACVTRPLTATRPATHRVPTRDDLPRHTGILTF